MKKYTKPYPTIGDLIKNKDYDYVDYRITCPGCDDDIGEFAGCFKSEGGKIISLDGDVYGEYKEVVVSEEWTTEKDCQKINGLTVVVEAALM